MRWLIALLLLLPAVAASQPACWPSEAGGSGSVAVFKQDSANRALVWLCCDAYQCKYAGFAGPRSAFVSDWLAQAQAARFGTDADRAALWTKYVTAPAVKTGSMAVNDAARAEVALRHPMPKWVVASNSTYTTRPAYAFVDGVRATVSASRADIGVPCNCAVRSVEGRSVYCAFSVDTSKVALCSRLQ